ncbi:AAA family ATPase [Candidatus Cryosericum septentrionale]|jgi:DNA sulfur modification protein DndD|uniref:Rad50/SbcC-type AAA domain-containing protein n=1 Tax=Candidatus Cryosericum septentrionale TaxID=2290913 RepID=A0A398DJT7_9BACT|nr:AAA family ATPase [Candidatus Cryosericum septentrionale]RIE15822.1 hypothetical protein SMC1_09400 [Candidatus Cryosericum septentrionale]
MILKQITVENFRQFRGRQSLVFAAGEPGKGKNVTVILGENGRGKTGLFRALMFCLYGDCSLAQDEDTRREDLRLVNTPTLVEASEAGNPVYATVQVEFTHHGVHYDVERRVKGVLHNGDHLEQVDKAELRYQDKNGNTKLVDSPSEIERTLNGILDRRVREYFLFDGEKIEHLTRSSAAQRIEVARGIRCLLDIDDLEKALAALKRLRGFLGEELSKVSTGEYAQVVTRLNELQRELDARTARLEEIDKELLLAGGEKKKLDDALAANEGIATQVAERKRLEDAREEWKTQANELLVQMRDRVGPSAVLLASNLVERVYGTVEDKRQSGEIPTALRKDLIERILSDEKCICGRPVTPGVPGAFEAILEWKNKAVDEHIENAAMDLWRLLSGLLGRFDDIRVFLETTIQRYGNLRNSMETATKSIESINEQIGGSERGDLLDLEKTRQLTESRMIERKAERLKIEDEIADREVERSQRSNRREQLERVEGQKSELAERVELALRTHEALDNVKSEFTSEVKTRLSDNASEIFSRLLDDEGRSMLRRIVVENDYSLQVLDPWDKPFLANISAGQRQVASISFILALARAAAGGQVLEMPLFMDTPFGKLSWQHRENLISQIPGAAAQWILLATDTELGRREASLLSRGGAWGKFAVLESQPDGSTTMREYKVSEALALLKNTEEDA